MSNILSAALLATSVSWQANNLSNQENIEVPKSTRIVIQKIEECLKWQSWTNSSIAMDNTLTVKNLDNYKLKSDIYSSIYQNWEQTPENMEIKYFQNPTIQEWNTSEIDTDYIWKSLVYYYKSCVNQISLEVDENQDIKQEEKKNDSNRKNIISALWILILWLWWIYQWLININRRINRKRLNDIAENQELMNKLSNKILEYLKNKEDNDSYLFSHIREDFREIFMEYARINKKTLFNENELNASILEVDNPWIIEQYKRFNYKEIEENIENILNAIWDLLFNIFDIENEDNDVLHKQLISICNNKVQFPEEWGEIKPHQEFINFFIEYIKKDLSKWILSESLFWENMAKKKTIELLRND